MFYITSDISGSLFEMRNVSCEVEMNGVVAQDSGGIFALRGLTTVAIHSCYLTRGSAQNGYGVCIYFVESKECDQECRELFGLITWKTSKFLLRNLKGTMHKVDLLWPVQVGI